MIKTIKHLKGSWFGPLLISVLCVSVLILGMPAKAPAGLVEYNVLLALTLVVVIGIIGFDIRASDQARDVVVIHLDAAVSDASLANSEGHRAREISSLSKAIGAAKALMGMTSSCDACDSLRSDLQQIIGLAALLKSQAIGVCACHPDGVIGVDERCDPLAEPTGCLILTSFCDENCQCQPLIIP